MQNICKIVQVLKWLISNRHTEKLNTICLKLPEDKQHWRCFSWLWKVYKNHTNPYQVLQHRKYKSTLVVPAWIKCRKHARTEHSGWTWLNIKLDRLGEATNTKMHNFRNTGYQWKILITWGARFLECGIHD